MTTHDAANPLEPAARAAASPGKGHGSEHGRYTSVAIALHWAIAALIIANLALGSVMERFKGPLRGELVDLHVSFGFTVFALSIARVAWRLSHRPPALPDDYPAWERFAAHAAHAALYVMMLVMPVIGWLILSANLHRPMQWFGLFAVPPWQPLNHLTPGPAKHALHDQFVAAHTLGGWILFALLLLHVGAALKHQWMDKEPELERMGVGRFPSTP